MNTKPEALDMEHDLVQWIVGEAVRAGMESPLRESILEAVEETFDETEDELGEEPMDRETSGIEEKSRVTEAVQGLTVFVVMFVVLYVLLKRLTTEEET